MPTPRRPIVTVAGVNYYLPTSDYVVGAGAFYYFDGTIVNRYESGQLSEYICAANTDANGRVTVYPTSNGQVTGTPLFSKILHQSCTALTASTDPTAAPVFFTEGVAADKKTVIFRGLTGKSALLTIGLNYSSTQYASSGIPGYVRILGLS